MSEIEELEARIMNLPREDMAKLRDWFLELDHQLWDAQIVSDLKAGKFKRLIDEARAEFAQRGVFVGWAPPTVLGPDGGRCPPYEDG